MSQLKISLLGSPQLVLDEVPVKIATSRAIPLLAFLALNENAQPREILAGLFWPDSTQKQALAALRTTLWRIKSAGLQDWISFDRNEISFNPHRIVEVDVLKFKAVLDRCNTHGHPPSHICLYCTAALTEAVEMYHGEFMAGCNISRTHAFEDWCMQQRVSLEMLHLDALERLVKCHRTFGDFNLAIHYARIWLSFDRLNENAQFQLLQLYTVTGQRTAGISLYKHCKELLWSELGIEPNEEITALYSQIATGRSNPVVKKKETAPVFMLMGIEKAALYWARAAGRKNEILTTYANIIKETSRRFGGLIVQRSEDNLTLLFENGQPLHCAVTIHLKLKKALWGSLEPPNIRMVLYAASTEGELPVNFALLTHTASTLLSISWGGQIIFTEQTLKLLDIPSGANLKDLGFHFLSESEGSVHLYELLHPHLPNVDHPPLQAITHQLVNFPILAPPFIGREQELDELTNLLATSDERIISLIGPGGVGKTRLAVQACTQAVKFFPDGTYFIPLSSIQDSDYLPIIIADVLKFSFFGTTNHLDQLGNYMHRMKALLVIDNFEHLRLEGARLLATLLSKTHHLKILITSRERLNMIAENVVEVHGLPVPDSTQAENAEMYSSIRLFVQNAHKILPGFSYTNNREALINICQIVDGIPLAILLASSWIRVFSCTEIASEIRHNINFLTTTASDVDPRHRSLIAVFDNSWELLSEEERHTLSLLSVFQAAFTNKAAQEICNASSRILSSYTDKSLLFHRPDDRFEMLGTFHQYASSKLEEDKDKAAAIRHRFCEYYADFCATRQASLVSSQQRATLDEIITELENIRIAWSWSVEMNRWDLIEKMKNPLFTYHVIVGNYVQCAELINLAYQKITTMDSPDLVLIKTSLQQLHAWTAFRRGFIQEGEQGLTTCLEIFRSQNDKWNIALTLSYLAEIQRNYGNNQQAKSLIEEALGLLASLKISVAGNASPFIAYCQSLLGRILMSMGDFPQARFYFRTSLATHEQLGTSYGTIHPLVGLAYLSFYEGDFLHARDFYLQALDIANNIYDSHDMILIHNNLGAVYEQVVNIPDASQHILTALKMCRETGDRRQTAVILNNLAHMQLKFLNQSSEAIRTYHESLEIFYTIGDLRGLTFTYYDTSKAYIQVGLLDEAWNYCIKSLNTAMTLDSIPLSLHALHGFANLFARVNFSERALGLCFLIGNNPQIDPDTKNRVIVTIAELEATVSGDIIQSAHEWAQSTSVQDAINQLMIEKFNPIIDYSK
jgi:predicted ATPase/DNA-binding SARP family transcriptional activator/tetratricopeptide (TPR) repeat protein